MSPAEQKMTDAAKAEDLAGLLDHIAWTDVLKPELLKARVGLSARLADAVLGLGANNGETMRPEQLAGMVYGVNMMVTTIETILRKGASAEAWLRAEGLVL